MTKVNFNQDMTEIIEHRKRVAAETPKRINTALEKRKARTKKQLDDLAFQREINEIESGKFA